jgi:plastocyanin
MALGGVWLMLQKSVVLLCTGGLFTLFFSLVTAVISPYAEAAAVQVLVTDQHGKPLADAVVELYNPQSSAKTSGIAEVAQQDLTFRPFVSAVQVGSKVDFPNQDKTRHHVYSFSPAKSFELKLYAGKPEAPLLFDKAGVVALGCNIHDYMQAYIYVGESAYLAVSGEDGIARFNEVPQAGYQLKLWHPWQDAEVAAQQVQVPFAAMSLQLAVTRQQKPSRPKKGFGNNY